jgi:putative membrane protein
MNNRTDLARAVHYSCRTAILAGFATYILLLVRHGGLGEKVEPGMTVIVKLSAIGLYALAICQLLLLVESAWGGYGQQEENCGCEESPPAGLGAWLKYGLFLLPLTIGMLELWRL